MAEKHSACPEAPEAAAQDHRTAAAEPVASDAPMPAWLAEAVQQGLRPEQLLACIGLGWMGRMGGDSKASPWMWEAELDGGQADLAALRQRLELIRLAIETAHRCGLPIGICGEAPSNDLAFVRFLVEQGIDSISLNPDALLRTRLEIARIERELAP